MAEPILLQERWPELGVVPPALAWLRMRADLGAAHRTIDAYARGLSEYLKFCADLDAEPLLAKREHVARFVRHLTDARRCTKALRLPPPVAPAYPTQRYSSGLPRSAYSTIT